MATRFNPEEVKKLRSLFRSVWQSIGDDVEQATEEGGERLTNAAVVETVLDADRPLFWIMRNKAQDHELHMLYRKFKTLTWAAQQRFVSRHCGRFV